MGFGTVDAMPDITEDRDAILQLLYRFNHAIDDGDAEAWADTFTEDGEFHAMGQVFSGREALLDWATSVPAMRRVTMNPVVDVEGDTAHVRAYQMMNIAGSLPTIGVYDDVVVRTPDGWRFAKRVFTADAPGSI